MRWPPTTVILRAAKLKGVSCGCRAARRSYCKPLAGTPQRRLEPFPQFPQVMWHPSVASTAMIRCARPAKQPVDKSTAGGQPSVSRHARSGETIICAPLPLAQGLGVTNFRSAGSSTGQGLRRWAERSPCGQRRACRSAASGAHRSSRSIERVPALQHGRAHPPHLHRHSL